MAQPLPHTKRFVEIFYRLKNAGKLPSNQRIAEQIGLKSGNTLTEISKGRQNIQLPNLQKFCEIYQVDLNEVLGAPGLIPREPNAASHLIPYFEGDHFMGEDRGLPATPAYYMDIPDFSGCTAFRIYSDSMSPLIKPGGIMFCKKVEGWRLVIEFGQVYVILLNDERKFLKYICKHQDPDKFLLKSANGEHDTFSLPKNLILSIWLVEGWMNKKTQ